MLQTINMVSLPACYIKYSMEIRNREALLSQDFTPYLKTHGAGEYTNTRTAGALM